MFIVTELTEASVLHIATHVPEHLVTSGRVEVTDPVVVLILHNWNFTFNGTEWDIELENTINGIDILNRRKFRSIDRRSH